MDMMMMMMTFGNQSVMTVRKDYLFLITLSEGLQAKGIFTSFNVIIVFDFIFYLNVHV